MQPARDLMKRLAATARRTRTASARVARRPTEEAIEALAELQAELALLRAEALLAFERAGGVPARRAGRA